MTKSDYSQLFLTCVNRAEAENLANTLLVKQLIVCAKILPVSSTYRWRGKIEKAEETLLIMLARTDLTEAIESAIATVHSYDTFVLETVPVSRLSAGAARWLNEELTNHG